MGDIVINIFPINFYIIFAIICSSTIQREIIIIEKILARKIEESNYKIVAEC